MNTQQIAQTTLAQLAGSEANPVGRLTAMLGAKDFGYEATVDGVVTSFKFSISPRGLWNYVKITLHESTDTYTVQFARITKGRDYSRGVAWGDEHAPVYADNLRRLFESETGLRVSQ
jgi:hypothetical protein